MDVLKGTSVNFVAHVAGLEKIFPLCQYKKEIKFGFYSIFFTYILYGNFDMFHTSECLIDISSYTSKVFREPENCDFCTNVSTVDKLSKISPINFYEHYQKPARPLIVTDAIEHWPASKTFEYKFFKELYENFKFDGSSKKNCQFFPYKTNFKSLSEVFQMSEKRANLAAGEKSWYVGWNNCNDKAGKILRQYYSKPYFLGNRTENIAMSWIFMGGPGHGAQMHVDNVYYPSWQAQLRGRKLWILAPPPECWNSCQKLEAEVKTGETIVVDTNRWYHQTIVLPGEISITIGSEFD